MWNMAPVSSGTRMSENISSAILAGPFISEIDKTCNLLYKEYCSGLKMTSELLSLVSRKSVL